MSDEWDVLSYAVYKEIERISEPQHLPKREGMGVVKNIPCIDLLLNQSH